MRPLVLFLYCGAVAYVWLALRYPSQVTPGAFGAGLCFFAARAFQRWLR